MAAGAEGSVGVTTVAAATGSAIMVVIEIIAATTVIPGERATAALEVEAEVVTDRKSVV